jgi:hypothetical protein
MQGPSHAALMAPSMHGGRMGFDMQDTGQAKVEEVRPLKSLVLFAIETQDDEDCEHHAGL